MKGNDELKGQWVSFQVRDVYLPPPEQVLQQLYGRDVIQGRVLDLTDDGTRANAFALVDVGGTSSALVVPVEKIVGVLSMPRLSR